MSEDWFDGKPFVVTDDHMKSQCWRGFQDGRLFRCHMCGVFFGPGSHARFVWVNGIKEARDAGVYCGNVMVCAECDGPRIYERLAEHERIIAIAAEVAARPRQGDLPTITASLTGEE